jgi:mediator of RNA polymerase II transcription subunit 14
VKEQDKRADRPSDEPEGMTIHVDWKPQQNALGMPLKSTDNLLPPEELVIVSRASLLYYHMVTQHTFCNSQDPDNLDVEALLRKVIWVHSKNLLQTFAMQLTWSTLFGKPDEVILDINGAEPWLFCPSSAY